MNLIQEISGEEMPCMRLPPFYWGEKCWFEIHWIYVLKVLWTLLCTQGDLLWYLLLLLLSYLCYWCSSMKHNNMACFCPSKSISLLILSCAKSIYCGLSFIYLRHAWWALQAGIAHGFCKGLSVSLCILYTSLSFKVQVCSSLLHNMVSINLSVRLGSAAF